MSEPALPGGIELVAGLPELPYSCCYGTSARKPLIREPSGTSSFGGIPRDGVQPRSLGISGRSRESDFGRLQRATHGTLGYLREAERAGLVKADHRAREPNGVYGWRPA